MPSLTLPLALEQDLARGNMRYVKLTLIIEKLHKMINVEKADAHLVRFDPRAVGVDLVRFCLFLTLCADGGPDLVRLKRFWEYLLAYCF